MKRKEEKHMATVKELMEKLDCTEEEEEYEKIC